MPTLDAGLIRLWGLLRNPAEVAKLDEDAFGIFWSEMLRQRAAPIFLDAVFGDCSRLDLPETRLSDLRAAWAGAKASGAVWGEGVERCLALFAERGLTPTLLKGADIGQRYFRHAFLRPATDLDVLFDDLGQAEAAQALLQVELGYRQKDVRQSADPWSWSHHLPTLYHPRAAFAVEVHGGLLFPPRDRRAGPSDCLLENREEMGPGFGAARALRPEANIVYLAAHTFLMPENRAQSLRFLLDAHALLTTERSRFSWDRTQELAMRSGLLWPFQQASELIHAASPELGGPSKPSRCPAQPPRGLSLSALSRVLHAKGLVGPVRLALHMAFPSRQYMAFRYPHLAQKPLPVQYAARWSDWLSAPEAARQ